MPCPCCDPKNALLPGHRLMSLLCDDCARAAYRLQACPHEEKR